MARWVGDGRSNPGPLAREPSLRPVSFLLLGILITHRGGGRKPRNLCRGLESLVQDSRGSLGSSGRVPGRRPGLA